MKNKTKFSPAAHLRPLAANWRRATPGDAPLVKRRRYYLYSFDVDKGWQQNSIVPCVDLDNGQLYINGIQIVHPCISHDQVSWLQHARDSNGTHYLAGHLDLHSNGLEAHGVVVVGTNHKDAIQHTVLASVIPNVAYKTRITSARYSADTDPSKLPLSAWEDGLALEISYQQQVGESVPKPIVTLDQQDISAYCSWSVDDRYTVLKIGLDDSICQIVPHLYEQAKLSFDALAIDAPGVGIVRKACSDTTDPGSKAWLWRADVVKSSADAASHTGTVSAFVMRQPERIPIASAHLLSTADDDLSINELMTLLPNDKVNEEANSMLMRNMKWAMGQDAQEKQWLAQFFNQIPPPITNPDQQALVKQSLDWYQNKFAKAYLTNSFNTYKGYYEPKHRLDKRQAAKVSDFLSTGLAQDRDFNIQHMGIYVDAYVNVKSDLAKYIADSTPEVVGWAQGSVVFSRTDVSAALTVPIGVTVKTAAGVEFMTQAATTLAVGQATSAPVAIAANNVGQSGVVVANTITQFDDQAAPGITAVTNPVATTLKADTGGVKWAKKLFAALTTDSQFILMVNRVAGAAGDPKALGPINNFACLLTALDRSGAIANNYFQSVLSGVIVKLVPDVVQRDKKTIMQWLPTTMQEVFRKLANGELPKDSEISEAEAKAMNEEFLKHPTEISSAVAELMLNVTSGGLIRQATAVENQFNAIAARWPRLAKACKLILVFGWAGGMTSVIMSLVKGDWEKMSKVERAEFVVNCVQLTVTGFKAVPLLFQGVRYITLSIWNKLQAWWNAPAQQNAILAERAGLAEVDIAAVLPAEARNIEAIIAEARAARAFGQDTIFERIFADGKFSGVLKIIGAVAAAAMAGFSLWQLINDVSHGSVTTIVFDSLMFAANLLSTVCLVADLFVATSYLPIVGAVLAIAGFIIGILGGFFEEPANPVDDWMVNYGIPFAKDLPEQKPSPAAAQLQWLAA